MCHWLHGVSRTRGVGKVESIRIAQKMLVTLGTVEVNLRAELRGPIGSSYIGLKVYSAGVKH